jgi:hypothetical protein
VAKIKYFITDRTEEDFINQLINKKATFEVKCTNYTTEVIQNEISFLFSASKKTNFRLFGTYQTLKSQVKNIITPSYEGLISYFRLNLNNILNNNSSIIIPTVINIDITAAYATTLLNKKYIDKKLFTKITALPKIERLAVVGMLATKKHIFEFKQGEQINCRVETDAQKRNIFFEASHAVNEIMEQCAIIAGEDFLFFWVDGIYLKTDRHKNKIQEFIAASQYNYKTEILKNFTAEIKENKTIFVTYEKGEKIKTFNLPISNKQKLLKKFINPKNI